MTDMTASRAVAATGDGVVGEVALVDHMGSDMTVVESARICRNAVSGLTDEKARRLLKTLLDMEHLSVFEHCVLSFVVTCPIFVRTHLFRYRTASPTEWSGRIPNKSPEVWQPGHFRGPADSDAESVIIYRKAVETAVRTYETLIAAGVPPEQARSVLPQGTMTRFKWTIDLRNFMHVWDERSKQSAQHETRAIVRAMAGLARAVFPLTGELCGWPDNNINEKEQ